MTFNLNDFRSTMMGEKFGGLAEPSKFVMEFDTPFGILSRFVGENVTNRDVVMFCEAAILPGKNLTTVDIKRQGYGDITKAPVSRTTSSIQCSFFCDSKYQIVKYFQQWMDYIIEGSDIPASELMTIIGDTTLLRAHREIAYKEDYTTTLVIRGLNASGSESGIEYTLYNAHPVQIGDVQVGWELNDQITKIPIEFTYSHYTTKLIGAANPEGFTRSGVSLFNRLAQLSSIAGVISTIRRPRSVQDAINLAVDFSTILKTI